VVLGKQLQDGVVNSVLREVGVFQRITSIGQSESHTISAEHLDGVVQDQEVTLALGHLLFVSQQVTVGTDRFWASTSRGRWQRGCRPRRSSG
jgi:hypothetical protein